MISTLRAARGRRESNIKVDKVTATAHKQVRFRSAANERVARIDLENAVPVASVLPLTEAMMTEIEEPKSGPGHRGDVEM